MKIISLLLILGFGTSTFAAEETCSVRVKLVEVGIVREPVEGYATEILEAKIIVISSQATEPGQNPACAQLGGKSVRSDHIIITDTDYLAAKAGKEMDGIYSLNDSETTWSLNAR